ncbi:MAG TPA: DUF4268 domain-containing protein [Pyrinomonadaceae bacterium]|nr:DUF4268 domain-containing protein [Pyrinomonadaceae bacterium]
MMKLSRLEKVDLRNIWKHEALDFTNWLAEPDNLSLLGDEIGIDISLIQTEASVGKFSVDILAEEQETGRKIIIENQLETTDHDHLGKIITYASGLDAEIIIWIVREVRDEHKQAIDWLNEHTDEKINFFAIKMEIWKIEDSPYAPKFYIVSQPNDWAKIVKQTSTQTSKVSETRLLQLEFWEAFAEFAQNRNSSLKIKKPNRPKHYCNIRFGSSIAIISLSTNSQSNEISCELYIYDDKEFFYALEKYKDEIQQELNCQLIWMELPTKKASRIKVVRGGNIKNSDDWNDYFEWFLERAETFQRVFPKYIRMISQ